MPDFYVSRDEVLDILLTYGWVDGRLFRMDDNRVMQLVSPRNPHKPWAKWYRDRAEALIGLKKMRTPGLKLIEAAKANGLWSESKSIEKLMVPIDLKTELKKQTLARKNFETYPPSYVRNLIRWIESAKTQKTRMARIAKIVESWQAAGGVPGVH